MHACTHSDAIVFKRSNKEKECKKMPAISHMKAAEAHESAAKIHRAAAEQHQKGDHKAGLEHSKTAMKLSETAHEDCCKGAHAKSKTAAH